MQRHARDSALGSFLWRIFPVADDGMFDRRELNSYLILQSRSQRDSHQRRIAQKLLHTILQLGARCSRIALTGRLLEHSLAAKVVNQTPFFGFEVPANHREILSHRSMAEKLPHQRVAIACGLGEQENAGGKAVDAMDYERPLSPRSQFGVEDGQRRRRVRALDRHRQQAGRFVQDCDRIVFVEDGHFSREARAPPLPTS